MRRKRREPNLNLGHAINSRMTVICEDGWGAIEHNTIVR